MDFENYTSGTIYGTGTEGTIIRLTESDHVAGVRGMGLHVHGNGFVRLSGSGTECWTNLDNCTSGMTVSIWFRTSRWDTDYIFSSGSGSQQGFTFVMFREGHTKFWVKRETPGGFWDLGGNKMSVDTWHLMTGTFDGKSIAQVKSPEIIILRYSCCFFCFTFQHHPNCLYERRGQLKSNCLPCITPFVILVNVPCCNFRKINLFQRGGQKFYCQLEMRVM